jgi:hypothetical protein
MREARRRVVAVALALALQACGPPDGPQPIAWDREPCAHCRMLISDAAFAAQLHRSDGTVESFDDPGCLLARLEKTQSGVRALWFHHWREERWLARDAVAFERGARTPMDFGLGAVDLGAPGSIPIEEARAELRARAGEGP